MRAVFHVRHDLAFGRPMGAQFVDDHTLWRQILLLQKSRQQAPGGLGVRRVWTISSSTYPS
ncbi:hypothetical protein X734_32425 [Mesorhizobium sp. L2C084A000]|nr:hypothetical protein X734_32425 [Mesorhizobium sp. L2C084A000]